MLYSISTYGVEAYFNYNENSSYTDPYRDISRQGDNLEQEIVEFIKSAKSEVNVAVQEIRLPLIAQALINQKNKGLRVRVIIESEYNNNILNQSESMFVESDPAEPRDHESARYIDFFAFVDIDGDGDISEEELESRDAIYMLRKAGVVVKDDRSDGSSGSGLMHHKFITVDNKKTLVSTANFTMSGIHGDYLKSNTRGNFNSLVVIDSKKFSKFFNQEFSLMWGDKNKRPKFKMSKPYRGVQKIKINNETEVKVQFSPTSKQLNWADSVNGLIGKEILQAGSEVKAALFVFTDQNIANILGRKYFVNSSFNIGMLVEPKFAYRSYSEMLDIWGLQLYDENCQVEDKNQPWKIPLYNTGVPARNHGDLLHHKFAVIDRETVILGSQNWSTSANYTNDENIVVIKNRAIARMYLEEFDRLDQGSRKGPSRSLLRRVDEMNKICQ